jgi:hypothetical protein
MTSDDKTDTRGDLERRYARVEQLVELLEDGGFRILRTDGEAPTDDEAAALLALLAGWVGE